MSSIISSLAAEIRHASVYNANTQHAPVAILWPDKENQWQSVIPMLKEALPELFVLGDYGPANNTGPAIWLKCVIADTLEDIQVPAGATPIVYLPGISRGELRDIERYPELIKPLAELQYRGTLWTQHNGKDWTALAFLTAMPGGLGLDVAKGKADKDALLMALPEILQSDIKALENKLLTASDFNQLLTNDPIRDLLSWMNSPTDVVKQWSGERWRALCNEIRNNFDLDLEKDGEFAAAEKLCAGEGVWANVWQRYSDSPDIYPSLVTLLERVPLPDILTDSTSYPHANMLDEDRVREALASLVQESSKSARDKVLALEKTHGFRRDSLWAKLEKAPWAKLLEPLSKVAELTQKNFGGLTPQEIGDIYSAEGWVTDAAAMRAIELCANKSQLGVVENVLAVIYTPWLADVNERFQKEVQTHGYPGKTLTGGNHGVAEAVADYKPNGEVVFFVDGLRLDVAHRLQELLDGTGLTTKLSTQWSALPSVTATAKAAVSPVYPNLIGLAQGKDFEPSVKEGGALSQDRFKRELAALNWQHLDDDDIGDPSGNAWVACGDIDKEGHKSELKLPGRIPLILEGIVERVIELQAAGWQKIRIVTDHGWLLVPGKLPKSQLPAQTADSRWGRCAQLKQNVKVDGLTLGWYWNPNIPIHFPHGIHSFIAGRRYAHGGVSLQECVVPIITVVGEADKKTNAVIKSISWNGLTCKLEVTSDSNNLIADMRTDLADGKSTLVKPKPLKDGEAVLMILDDESQGLDAIVVVCDSDGKVLAKQVTTVGGDEEWN